MNLRPLRMMIVWAGILLGCLSGLGGQAATNIDVLMVFDASAGRYVRSTMGGDFTLVAEAQLAKMNQAHVNSASGATFVLAGVQEVTSFDYATPGSTLSSALIWAKDAPEIAAKRNEAGADVVCFLVDTGSAYGTTGLGYQMGVDGDGNPQSLPGFAFCSVSIRSAEIRLTATHEIGHILGCGHSRTQKSNPGPGAFSYAAGWYFKGNDNVRYHSIMAYDDEDGNGIADATEVPYFSAPEILYKATAVGTADADNARCIRATAAVVAAYRSALVLSPTECLFPAAGGSQSVAVTCNGAWTVESDQAWLAVDPVSGSGNGSVSLTATANPTFLQRTATVTFAAAGSFRTVSVVQEAAPQTVAVAPTAWTASKTGNSQVVTVTANGSWTASSNQAWLTLTPASGSGNGSVTLTAAANATLAARTATVTFKAGSVVATVVVTQPTIADPYEPNNTLDTATVGLFSGLGSWNDVTKVVSDATIHTINTSDYYKFEVGLPGTVKVTLDNLPSNYGAFLYGYDVATSAWKLLKTTTVAGAVPKSLSCSLAAGSYAIRVGAGTGAAASANPYRLTVAWDGPQDRYEPNNSLETATAGLFNALGGWTDATKVVSDATIHTVSTSDFYSFSVTQTGTVTVALDRLPSNYGASLYGYDSGAAAWTLLKTTSVAGAVPKSLSCLLVAGNYAIQVGPEDGAVASANPYRLTVAWDGAQDRYEPNNSLATATAGLFNALGGWTDVTKVISDATIHTINTSDYYRFEVAQPGTVTVSLDSLPSNYGAFLYGYDAATSAWKLLKTTTVAGAVPKSLSWPLVAGSYAIRVGAGTGAVASVLPYQLKVAWDGPQDRYEPNNSLETATPALFASVGGASNATATISDATIHTINTSDYYKFEVTQAGTLTATLDNLPSNYGAFLYGYDPATSAWKLFKTTTVAGAVPKSLSCPLKAGTYVIRVAAGTGAVASASPYRLALKWTVP